MQFSLHLTSTLPFPKCLAIINLFDVTQINPGICRAIRVPDLRKVTVQGASGEIKGLLGVWEGISKVSAFWNSFILGTFVENTFLILILGPC